MAYLDFVALLVTVVLIVFAMIGVLFGLFAYFRKADRYALNNLHNVCELQAKQLNIAYNYIAAISPKSASPVPEIRLSSEEKVPDNTDNFVSPTRAD